VVAVPEPVEIALDNVLLVRHPDSFHPCGNPRLAAVTHRLTKIVVECAEFCRLGPLST
jgi:hypothetical protein